MAKTTKKTMTKAAAPAASTAQKPAAKKAAVKKKAVAKKVAVKKKAATAKKASVKKVPAKRAPARRISGADRRQMIAEAAYLRGESQGFLSDEREDWLLAEVEVDALLVKAKVDVID